MAAEVNSGNLDDKSWNFDYIEKLAATLTPEKLAEVIYVADSAIVTEANLEKLQSHNLKFISRLPGNFSLEKELMDRAWQEGSFKLLKDPLFVGPVFLKKPGRIEALVYVLLMALLLFGLLGRRVREAMKFETEPLLIPGKVNTFSPTGKKILDSLESVMVITNPDPNRRPFGNRFKVPRALKLAGFSPNIYLDVKERHEYLL